MGTSVAMSPAILKGFLRRLKDLASHSPGLALALSSLMIPHLVTLYRLLLVSRPLVHFCTYTTLSPTRGLGINLFLPVG